MISSQYDVLIVGAGCAGLTAAIGLARADFRVAVVEAAPFPGAASWSGCAYDTRHLAHPDILGPEGVEQLAWERRLIERGRFLCDGRRLLGTTYRDPEAFNHVHLVLRPVFDHSLAQAAAGLGVALLCGTSVESLVREDGRVRGVCTQRGPLYADLVFLAEGDASHLIAREGYEQSKDPRDAPRFLHAIKQVIELPPGAIEERFGVGPEQGVAHDFLLRNGSVNGQVVPLNMTGFVYTNRQSLSLGLMLPAEHLRAFAGSSPRLLAWLLEQPVLRPWWKDGRPGPLGARLLRAGGSPVPYLADAGLAVGGAASGIGTRLPVLDFIGPATLTGLLLVQAACRIRAEGGDFSREQLARHYLEPLQQTVSWKDTVGLQRWPGHVRRSRVLFSRALDLALDSADVWTSRRWLPVRLLHWCRLLADTGWAGWAELRREFLGLGWALRLRARLAWPRLSWALFTGFLNALRDLLRQPRAGLPAGGQLRLHFRTADAALRVQPPLLLRRWFSRIRPILEAAARLVYRTEPAPFTDKLTAAAQLLVQQLNLFDLLAAALLALLSAVGSVFLALVRGLGSLILRQQRPGLAATPTYDGVGGSLVMATDAAAHANPGIHLLWPRAMPDYHTLLAQGLEHICPTRVFDVSASSGAVQVQVHARRCIQCEMCWRVSPLVDWGRDPGRSLIYPVRSPVVTRLLQAQEDAGLAHPALPRCSDPWQQAAATAVALDETARASLSAALDSLEHKLAEFDRALEHEPAVVDRARAEHLEMLARYAHHLAQDVLVLIKDRGLAETSPVACLTRGLVAGAEERLHRAWEGRLAWAAADGRRLRQHHVTGLRRLLAIAPPSAVSASTLVAAAPGTSALLGALGRLVQAIEPARSEHGAALGCLVAAVATRRLLLETLSLPAQTLEGEAALREQLLHALAADVLGTTACYLREMQELTSGAHQEVLAQMQQQLAGERAAGRAAAGAVAAFGQQLLAGQPPLRVLLERVSGQEGVRRGRALQAEREEIERAQERLAALAHDWYTQQPSPADTVDAEVAERLGREALVVLGGQLLAAWIERRLEQGGDTELDAVLLRVWLDEREVSLNAFASFLRRRLHGLPWPGDRPLVEPDLPPPERSLADYLAAPSTYASGDFLLAAVDLRQARLVPEMLTDPRAQLRDLLPSAVQHGDAKHSLEQSETDLLHLLAQLEEQRPNSEQPWWPAHAELTRFLASAVVCTLAGRLRQCPAALDLEEACAAVVVRELLLEGARLAGAGEGGRFVPPSSLQAQLAVLRGLVASVLPRCTHKPPPRHLGREALELEALKAAWRQSVARAGDVFLSGRWENPTVQVSCLALAAATAWLFAADCVLGRLAWLDRAHADEDSPAPGRQTGLQALARCHASVRDALRRFEEDLAALRRGYVVPHLRVPPLLRPAPTAPIAFPLAGIRRPLTLLVFLEPRPAVLATAEGEQVLEAHWELDGSDRAALETALRLRDAAPGQVSLHVAAVGPRRIGPVLREVHSLHIEHVDLFLHDSDTSSDEAAAVLAGRLRPQGPFDLLLAGDSAVPADRHLALLLAKALGLPLAGQAARLVVQEDRAVLCRPDGQALQERSLPAAVLVQPGLPLRPFTTVGYLQGLRHSPAVHALE